MKRDFILILGVIILISACSSPTPIGTQSVPEELIQTAISKTQTAKPIQGFPAQTQPLTVEPIQELPAELQTPPALGSSSPTEEIDTCEANKWRFVPTFIEEHNLGDGWKILQIEMGIENGSQYWGFFYAGGMTLKTEGGFIYNLQRRGLSGPEFTPNCISGYYSCHDSRNMIAFRFAIPPGYITRGYRGSLYNFVFKVAENQNQYTLILPYDVTCYLPGGAPYPHSDTYVPIIEIDLNSNTQQVSYPVYENITLVPNLLEQPIEIPELGVMEFTGVERKVSEYGDTLFIHSNFTNANQGYESSGWLRGYIIGEDGMMHEIQIYTIAGPGQTIEQITEVWIPTGLKNMKLVLPLLEDLSTNGPKESVLIARDIPDGIIQIVE